jgi:sulfite exporter TauE/SafE
VLFFSVTSKTIETSKQICSLFEVNEMNSSFRIVFYTAVGITMFSFGTNLYLASQPDLSQVQTQIFDTCNKVSMGGAFAIFGLLARRKLLN